LYSITGGARLRNLSCAKGWQPVNFQRGSANFRVLNSWNAAAVYNQAIRAIRGAPTITDS
jgi:membrane-bound lytic murein transglycosylase B